MLTVAGVQRIPRRNGKGAKTRYCAPDPFRPQSQSGNQSSAASYPARAPGKAGIFLSFFLGSDSKKMNVTDKKMIRSTWLQGARDMMVNKIVHPDKTNIDDPLI